MNKKTLYAITLGAACTLLAASANAQCGKAGPPANAALSSAARSIRVGPGLRTKPAAVSAASSFNDIVGLWDATFYSEGEFFDEGFDQFHSDGTEMLNDIPNPITGNVCLGVWSGTGHTVKLHHVFWQFDTAGNLVGRGTWDSVLTIDGDTYTGTWTMKTYDPTRTTIIFQATGTVQAVRISAP